MQIRSILMPWWLSVCMVTVLTAPLRAQDIPGKTTEPPSATDKFAPLSGLDNLLGQQGPAIPTAIPITARYLAAENSSRGIMEIIVDVPAGWHIYSVTQQAGGPMRTAVQLSPSSEYRVTGRFEPEEAPHVVQSPYFPVPEEKHEGRVVWRAPLDFATGVDLDQVVISGELKGQICQDAGACVPLSNMDTRFTASFAGYLQGDTASATGPGAAEDDQPATMTSPGEEPPPPSSRATWPPGIGNKIAGALLAGLLLNLMPCVLPVIGLKIMSFAQQAGEARSRVFWLNLAFVLGLLTVFAGLGGLAAFLGWGWGEQFQRPEFGIALSAIVFVFALSFLGIWEIPIPGFVGAGKAAEIAEREGITAAFLKGVLTTLLATPCSGPLIVPTLAWALTQQKPVIFTVFIAMGIGMGLPYLILGLFPDLLRLLPKPGPWMETFKQVMGFVLLGTVVWIFTFLDADLFVPTLALLFALWAACWWIGRIPISADLDAKATSYLLAVVFAAAVGFFSFRVLTPGVEWPAYSAEALDTFRAKGVTVLVDFTADW